jgi:hypothetical protein
MSAVELRDIVDRLEFAQRDVINSQLGIIDGSEAGATDAMRAIVQIQHVLRELRAELQGRDDDEPTPDDGNGEIRDLASALASRRPQ